VALRPRLSPGGLLSRRVYARAAYQACQAKSRRRARGVARQVGGSPSQPFGALQVFGWWVDQVEIVVRRDGRTKTMRGRRQGLSGPPRLVNVLVRTTPNIPSSVILLAPSLEEFVANSTQATFPTMLVAGIAKAAPAELWQITDGAEREVPTVDLSADKPAL
jgi:hypothetical protein